MWGLKKRKIYNYFLNTIPSQQPPQNVSTQAFQSKKKKKNRLDQKNPNKKTFTDELRWANRRRWSSTATLRRAKSSSLSFIGDLTLNSDASASRPVSWIVANVTLNHRERHAESSPLSIIGELTLNGDASASRSVSWSFAIATLSSSVRDAEARRSRCSARCWASSASWSSSATPIATLVKALLMYR